MSLTVATYAITVITVTLCGLIAGQMLAIALANVAARKLPETSWTLRFQKENELFTKTMPASLLLPLAGLIGLAFWTPYSRQDMFILAGSLEAVVLAITMLVEVPINKQVQTWQAGSAPPSGTEVRDRWLRFHWIRTGLGIASFVCGVMGVTTFT
jgi:hypothetical protein